MKQLKRLPLDLIELFRDDLRFFTRAVDRINKSTCSLGINVPQCHAIMELGPSESLSVNALAEKMNLDKSTVSRQVENLVKSGIVERIADDTDRRMVKISLSERGLKIYEQMNNDMNLYFQDIFQKISKDKIDIFLKTFKTLAHLM